MTGIHFREGSEWKIRTWNLEACPCRDSAFQLLAPIGTVACSFYSDFPHPVASNGRWELRWVSELISLSLRTKGFLTTGLIKLEEISISSKWMLTVSVVINCVEITENLTFHILCDNFANCFCPNRWNETGNDILCCNLQWNDSSCCH